MTKKMLIDATHPEETRIVVVDGNKVDDFDFESINKRQLAGNIYLAKVTRVEPSLQAAFVDYGGNRHGFLPFSEIHPDYYQIPVADRQALLEEEERAAREESADEDGNEDAGGPNRSKRSRRSRARKSRAGQDSGADPADRQAMPAGDPRDALGDAHHESDGVDGLAILDAADPVPDPHPDPHGDARADSGDEARDAGETAQAPDDKTPDEKTPGAKAAKSGGRKTVTEGAGLKDERITEEAEEIEDAPVRPKASKRAKKTENAAEETAGPEDAAQDSSAESDGKDRKKAGKGASDKRRRSHNRRKGASDAEDRDEDVESIGAENLQEEAAASRARHRRNYKIQDVVKVRQIMLVQVVKEERQNKGAALTTYMSLAGRYCVLMPNTARGGGVSRKITQAGDRKRLREIMGELEVPKGMGLIARTAGAERTRAEIKRDYEFLSRQWEQTRELTLKSIAPCLIYEEGSLVKRSIRDLYSKEIDTILVEGENGYREAKDYMKMLMPSHAKNVQQYADQIPLFIRYQIESTLNGMFSPTVQLKSGGYIVIGLTEALVAIDVNSGRATKQGSIEETALQTNLEAADEVARQCRLRDLAGLIVVDFIDMEENRNNRAVEKRLKDQLKNERARIQIGRISSFGLLEMSRQRLRPGMLEATTSQCRHCQGMGVIRSVENVALSILREVEEEGVRGRSSEIQVAAPVDVANFLLNHKRAHIAQIEERYGVSALVVADLNLISPDYRIERSKQEGRAPAKAPAVVTAVSAAAAGEPEEEPSADREGDRKRSRRRGGRGGRRKGGSEASQGERESSAQAGEEAAHAGAEEKPKRSRRRRRGKDANKAQGGEDHAPQGDATAESPGAATGRAQAGDAAVAEENRSGEAPGANPETGPRTGTKEGPGAPEPKPEPAPDAPARPKRRGWWSLDL